MEKIIFRISFFVFVVMVTTISFRCRSEQIAAEIGDEKITLNEFRERYLEKCGYNTEVARNNPVEDKISFLNKIINTEMKAMDGKEKGLDTLESFVKEMQSGKKILLAESYINEKLIEPDLKNYYDKIKFEIRASHILLTPEKFGSSGDSAKTYLLATEIIKRLSAGESFESLAKIYSADTATRDKGGDLYYFSPGMTLPNFEYAAFNLEAGEFTKEPVRTPLGIHIIKLTDKKARYDSVRISHILITDRINESGEKDSIASYKKIKEIHERLKAGEKFEDLAGKFSNDTINKHKGGDFGYIKRRQFGFIFDSTAFSLKPGQISDIIRTEFGWHIIKMTEAVKIKPFEEIRDLILLQYKTSVYYRKNYEKLISELRRKYNLRAEKTGIDFLIEKIKDTTLAFAVINPNLLFSGEDKNVVTAKYTGGEVTINDLIVYISRNSAAANKVLTISNIRELFLSSADEILLSEDAISEGINKSEKYIKSVREYEKYLLADCADKYLITPGIKISETEIQDYYSKDRKQFRVSVNGIEKDKGLNEVRNEIISALKNSKFKDTENIYLENLKIKYNVIVNYSFPEDLFEE